MPSQRLKNTFHTSHMVGFRAPWRRAALRPRRGSNPMRLRWLTGPDGLAGLWENWRSPAGETVRSFAIITTTPNELCAEIHNRMPVVLKPTAWPAWLGEEPADPR